MSEKLEELISLLYQDRLTQYGKRSLVKNIEKLQKENEELKKLMAHKNAYTEMLEKDLFENCSNYVISKQKVKDKIEELNQYYKKEIYPSLYQWCDITITEHYDEMIELLQELLEGGENG